MFVQKLTGMFGEANYASARTEGRDYRRVDRTTHSRYGALGNPDANFVARKIQIGVIDQYQYVNTVEYIERRVKLSSFSCRRRPALPGPVPGLTRFPYKVFRLRLFALST